MKPEINIAVVGVGYFGSFHCSKLASISQSKLVAVVDVNTDRAQKVAQSYGVPSFSSHQKLLESSIPVDAVIVAVPTSIHYQVTADLLMAGKDLLVEKPMATSIREAEHLCQLVEENGSCLQVGHLERYNPIFLEALKQIKEPRYIRMERSGPFSGRGGDVDVVLDLMTHDLDLLLQLTDKTVERVAAWGDRIITPFYDIASARIEFTNGLLVELLASRVATQQVRRFSVLDSAGVLEVDLGQCCMNRVSGSGSQQVTLGPVDALFNQTYAFIDVLQNGRQPLVDSQAGRATVELATKIKSCIQNRSFC